MPIFNDFVGLKPRFRFKACPNCGSDVKFGMKECCVKHRLTPSQYKPRVKKELKAIVCMNPADEKKYVLIPQRKA